ncbi:MAG: hypothetical protein FJX57_06220, partial [Alphaproteobacteria bacterium]|nr:hypothetical protein [Alphaproteobacteria bacterium]
MPAKSMESSMAPELPGQDSDVVRPIARRLIRFTCLAVLVAVAVAAGHVLLGTGPSFVLASAGAIVIAV